MIWHTAGGYAEEIEAQWFKEAQGSHSRGPEETAEPGQAARAVPRVG